jgi:hypothetical protein
MNQALLLFLRSVEETQTNPGPEAEHGLRAAGLVPLGLEVDEVVQEKQRVRQAQVLRALHLEVDDVFH